MDNDRVYLKKPTLFNRILGVFGLGVFISAISMLCSILYQELKSARPEWFAIVMALAIIGVLVVVMLRCAEGTLSTLEFSSAGVRVLLLGRELRWYPREEMGLFCYAYGGRPKYGDPYYHTGIVLLPPEEITERQRKMYRKKSMFRTEEKYVISKPGWERALREEYLRKKSSNIFRMRSKKWLFEEDKCARDVLFVLHNLYPEVPVEDYSVSHRDTYTQEEKQRPSMPLKWRHPNVEGAVVVLVCITVTAAIILVGEKMYAVAVPVGIILVSLTLLLYLYFTEDRIYIEPKGITVTRWKKTIRFWHENQIKTVVQLDTSAISGYRKKLCYLVISIQTREEILKSVKNTRNDWQELLSRLPDYEDRVIVKKMDMKKSIAMTYTPGLEALIRQTYPHVDYIPYPSFSQRNE